MDQQMDSPQLIEEIPPPALPPMEVDPPSIRDHQAFAQMHLTGSADLEEEDFQIFTWRLKDYRSLPKKLSSDKFMCGGHEWDILFFPLGNNSGNGDKSEMCSVYLNAGDSKTKPEGWHVCAHFALAISNPGDPTIFFHSQAQHRFTQEEQDWGFTRFHELRKLFQPVDGRSRPIIENEEVEITAFVRVLKDPTGVLWHNFQNYDSKKETGFVGLKNQGATCYMNSLLQSLFCTNAFRKAVYQVPTGSDEADSAIPLALQRVFYLLQTSDQPVSTTDLTKSFGWDTLDSFLQHDVEEFLRKLMEKVETKMKNTPADGSVGRLFAGKMKSYIKCINVDYQSDRTEEFYDIQLNIKGHKHLEDSFKDYIAVETLEGENRYQAEGLGLQDAKKGVIFQTLPPVLHLHLMRFEYDFQRDAQVKINDRFEYPLEIDLTPFVEAGEKPEKYIYRLHGVLVHAGDVNGGHYYVLIKPTADGRWLRFDDERVTPVTDREVLEDNFGVDHYVNGQLKPMKALPKRHVTSAYFLVYIRDTHVDEVLAPITETDTPKHLRERLEAEKRDAEQRRREKEEQHLYLTTKIITNETFKNHQGFDLATFEDRTLPVSNLPSYRVPKNKPFVEFKTQLAQEMGLPPDEVRLWVLVTRQNKTVRPDIPVPENDPTWTMEMVRDKMTSRQNDLKLYLDHVTPDLRVKQNLTDPNANPLMIFVKHFDYSQQTLSGVGQFYVNRHMKVGDLMAQVNDRLNRPLNTPMKLYEEIKPGMIEPMKPKLTFQASEIQEGDIICFQWDEAVERDAHDINKPFTDPIQFYEWFLNRVMVHFKPRPRADEAPPQGEEFQLMLSKKLRHEDIARRVGEHLKYDYLKIRLISSQGGHPATAIKKNVALADVIQGSYQNTPSNLVFYELLDLPLQELETKKTIHVHWTGATNREEPQPYKYLLPKTNAVQDIVDHLTKDVELTASGSGRIRIFTIESDGTRQKEVHTGDVIRDLNKPLDLYAEEIPLEEINRQEADKVVNVLHFSKEPTKVHGVPFQFVLKPDEQFSETKKRLQTRTGTNDRELAKMKFVIYQPGTYNRPCPINDEDVLYDHDWKPKDALGLDHVDKNPRRTEKAIVIR